MNWDEKHRRAMAVFAGDDDDLGVLLMYRQLEGRIGEIVGGAVLMRGAEGLEDVAALLMMDEEEVDRRWAGDVIRAQLIREAGAWIEEVGWDRGVGEVDLAAAVRALRQWRAGREEGPADLWDVEAEDAIRWVLEAHGGRVSEDRRTVKGVRLRR